MGQVGGGGYVTVGQVGRGGHVVVEGMLEVQDLYRMRLIYASS